MFAAIDREARSSWSLRAHEFRSEGCFKVAEISAVRTRDFCHTRRSSRHRAAILVRLHGWCRLPTAGRSPAPDSRRRAKPAPAGVTAENRFSNPAHRRGKTHLSANNQDQRALLTPARARRSTLTAPASSRRSLGQIGRGRCVGSAPSARSRVGVHRAASRDSESVLRAAADTRLPTAGRSPAPDSRRRAQLGPRLRAPLIPDLTITMREVGRLPLPPRR